MNLEKRIRKAERSVCLKGASEVDTLTAEELEQIRTALRMVMESGVPLTLPSVHTPGDREQAL